MPQSGSYFYPQLQTPNSSYPSVVLRGVGAAPAQSAQLGKLYILSSSGDLSFEDQNGNFSSFGSARGALILSSSSGSIVLSGAVKYNQFTVANLPTSSDNLSGTMVYVSDKKCFAVYTPEGWFRLASGTL